MTTPIRNVIVIGASGNLGAKVTSTLLAAGFKVSALTRLSSTSTFPAGLTVLKTDYSHASLLKVFQGQDAVVSTTSTSSLTGQKAIIDAAAEAGIQRFIPSEYGWDSEDHERALDVAPCMTMKIEPVKYLQEKESSVMSWTAICGGLWLEWVCIMLAVRAFLTYTRL